MLPHSARFGPALRLDFATSQVPAHFAASWMKLAAIRRAGTRCGSEIAHTTTAEMGSGSHQLIPPKHWVRALLQRLESFQGRCCNDDETLVVLHLRKRMLWPHWA